MAPTATNRYDHIASIYDVLAYLYSAGSILRSKQEHLRLPLRGKKVLYAGAGTGAECAIAAAQGAQVTVCDSSQRMLARARARIKRAALAAHFEAGDALTVPGTFDVVVAPYFLNVFCTNDVGSALDALAHRVKPGGQLITVDFRAPSRRLSLRVLQQIYYFFPQLLFWALARNPWHPLYDYPKLAQKFAPGLVVQSRIVTPVLGFPLLETICFERVA